MGTNILQRSTPLRAAYRLRPCCLASTRSLATTLPEAGSRVHEPPRQKHRQAQIHFANAEDGNDSSDFELRHGRCTAASGSQVHALGAELLAGHSVPLTLLPPPLEDAAVQLTSSSAKRQASPDGLETQRLEQWQQGHNQHYYHQLGRGNPHVAIGRGVVPQGTQRHQQQEAPVQPAQTSDPELSSCANGPRGPLATNGLHDWALQSTPAAVLGARQRLQELGDARPRHSQLSPPPPDPASDTGQGLPPFLDAANRSGGEASTSNRCAPSGPGAGPGSGTGGRKNAGRQPRSHGKKAAPAATEGQSAVGETGAGTPRVHPRKHASVDGGAGSTSGSVDSSRTGRPLQATTGNVGVSSGGRGHEAGVGRHDGRSGKAQAVAALAAAAVVDRTPPQRHQDTAPLGPPHISNPAALPANQSVPPAASATPSPAAGGKGRGPQRKPRTHTPEEHRQLRERAAAQRAALAARAPTLTDLKLTTDVMRATHWRELLYLLSAHMQQHKQQAWQSQAEEQEHAGAGQPQQPRTDAEAAAAAHGPAAERASAAGAPQRNARQRTDQRPDAPSTSAPGSAPTQSPHAQRPLQQQHQHSGATRGGKAPAAAGPATAPAAAAAAAYSVGPGPGPGPPLPVSQLPLTPPHVSAILYRTAYLLEHVGPPDGPAEARQLWSMVDGMARMAAGLLQCPGMGMREISTILYSLMRLRHPVGKAYFISFMAVAQTRLAAARKAAERQAVLARQRERPGRRGSASGSGSRDSAAKSSHRTAHNSADSSVSGSSSDNDGAAGGSAQPPGTAACGGNSNSNSSSSLPYKAIDMAQLLYSVSRCGIEKLRPDWEAEYCAGLLPVVHELAPLGVATILYAMARLRAPPRQELLAALCGRLAELVEAGVEDRDGGADGGSGDGDGGNDGDAAAAADAAGSAAASGSQHSTQSAADATASNPAAAVAAGVLQDAVEAADADDTWEAAAGMYLDSYAAYGPVTSCRPVDVCMSLWALATLRLPPDGACPGLLPAVERYCCRRFSRFSPQELSMLAWALGRLQHNPGREFVHALYGTVLEMLYDMQPRALATLLYGLAEMRQRPGDAWLGEVVRHAGRRLRAANPQSLSLTIHALASMRYRPEPAWMAAFHRQLEAYPGQLDTRVRDKVREAYHILGFRPGGASPPAAAGGGAAAARQPRRPPAALPADAVRRTAAVESPPSRWERAQEAAWPSDEELLLRMRSEELAGEEDAGERERRGARVQVGAASNDETVLVRPSRFSF